MNKKRLLISISKLLFATLIVVVLFFIYTIMTSKGYEKAFGENIDLVKDNESLKREENELNLKAEELNREYEIKSQDFINQYGYEYGTEEKQVDFEIDRLKSNEKEIKNNMNDLISSYSKYYSGEYYLQEDLENIITGFINLVEDGDFKSIDSDIYLSLGIDEFISKNRSLGTLGEISRNNPSTKEYNILLFSTVVYSKNLYEISEGLSSVNNVDTILNDISMYLSCLKRMENLGFSTNKCSSENFQELYLKFQDLYIEYQENKAIIDALEER